MWLRITDELAHNLALADRMTLELPQQCPGPSTAVEVCAYYGQERRVIWWCDTYREAISVQVGIFEMIRCHASAAVPDDIDALALIWREQNPEDRQEG